MESVDVSVTKPEQPKDKNEKVCSLEYFCEVCNYYPLYPVHGHYECPQCRYKTKCCEGAPQ